MPPSLNPVGTVPDHVQLATRRTAQPIPLAGADAGAGPGSARRKVLIVDDEWLISMQLEQMIGAAGYKVVGVAPSVALALTLAERERPDLVLMDIRLSGPVDGVAAACALLERFGIRSLFVSAHGDAATVARGQAARPVGWLPKPFTEAELLRAVRAALAPS